MLKQTAANVFGTLARDRRWVHHTAILSESSGTASQKEAGYSALVRLFTTKLGYDYVNPWQSRSHSSSTGSGVFIAKDRILTAAHVVADATYLEAQRVHSPMREAAVVEATCHDCDLALVRVPSKGGSTPSAELGVLPRLRDRICVVGYPVGGEQLSVTEGVVSRIEVQTYSHSKRALLAMTVDAAVNPGNSGGPVFMDGKVCGIAFQGLRKAENIGHAVPVTLIRRFLTAVDDISRDHGTKIRPHPFGARKEAEVPDLGIRFQVLDAPALRRRVNLPNGKTGILVTDVGYASSAQGVLEPGDVIMSIAGYPVANNGTIVYDGQFRTMLSAIIGDYFVGDLIPMAVLRGGVEQMVNVQLRPCRPLVSSVMHDRPPTYFIFGGLVFQPLSTALVHTWKNPPSEIEYHWRHSIRTEQRKEVIILSKILSDAINTGYEHARESVVESVNGIMIRDLKHLVSLVESSDGKVEFRTSSGMRLVFDVLETQAANPRIIQRYRLPGFKHLEEDD